ncbi:MAG: lysophospholipid acyltransferase family protein [Gammaproteobacteria bacterium]
MARKLNWKRNLAYKILRPLISGILKFLWKTCSVEILGAEHGDAIIESEQPAILCYWHQQHVFGSYYALTLKDKGLKLGFLISPSVDGEVPARIVQSWGAHAIRGSSNRTGARAMRDLYQVITKEGISPVNTSDGPTGPIFKFKPGAVLLAQLTKAPMLPIAFAASSFWKLKSWDQFIIPKPFSKIVIAVGAPCKVNKDANLEQQASIARHMESTLNLLIETATKKLKS